MDNSGRSMKKKYFTKLFLFVLIAKRFKCSQANFKAKNNPI